MQEHGEKTLRELGLTFSQARVYLALVKLGTHSTVKAVSVFSNVARQDVYRTLKELGDLSLVEMVIGNPAMFKAIPFQETIAILMERQNQKTRALQAEAAELFKLLAKEKKVGVCQDNHQFVLIPKKEVLTHRITKAIEAAQENVVVIAPWRDLHHFLFRLHESWKQALNRGVEVQGIIEKQDEIHLLTEGTRALIGHPNFKLRMEPSFSNARFAVYDDNELFISILDTPNASDSPALWTNNPVLIRTLKDYFWIKWELTEEYSFKLIAQNMH